jgi:sn-glycerol 3-phosphate transport system substrate-binding protein
MLKNTTRRETVQHAKKAWQLLTLALSTVLGTGILVAYSDNTATPAPTATAAATPTVVAQAPASTPIPPVPQPAGSIKVTFWFGLTGSLGNVVQQVVNKYNSSQTHYYMEAVQQPDYDATIQKLNTSLAGGALPNVVQIYDIGTQRMIDTKKIVPVQDLMDKEKLDILPDLEPAVARYYTIGGKLYSMPFNSSAPVMYFNANTFKEAGLDPTKTVWTYDEVLDAAKKLTKKDASGKVTQYGVGFTLYSWIFEQELATQSALFATPDNGRNTRATQLIFNNAAGVNWLNFLKKLQDDDSAKNFGKDGGANSSNRDASFVSGESAMTFNSIAALRGYISSAQQAGGKVEVGVAYIPRPAGAKGGVIIGGTTWKVISQISDTLKNSCFEIKGLRKQP